MRGAADRDDDAGFRVDVRGPGGDGGIIGCEKARGETTSVLRGAQSPQDGVRCIDGAVNEVAKEIHAEIECFPKSSGAEEF